MTAPTTTPTVRNLLIVGWVWRCPGYVAAGLVVGLPALALFGAITAPWITAVIALGDRDLGHAAVLLVAGLPAIALAPLAAAPVVALERRRLRVVRLAPTPDPAAVDRDTSPPTRGAAWLRERYAGPRAGREVGCAILAAVVGPVLGTLAAVWAVVSVPLVLAPVIVAISSGPVALMIGRAETVPDALPYCLAGIASLLVGAYALSVLALAHARLTRALLHRGHQEHLAARLVEVTRSRSRLADAFAAERRRIERDLHDGAQQQLLGLSLQLGLARHDLPPDTPAGQAVARAHEQAKALMVALRELIRGIHPQVLTERGLAAALHELAECCPLPVGTDIDLPERPPQAVETAAYFAAAEALANALKHSGADRADITARLTDGLLTVDIRDNGRGGAHYEGTGLTGLADRVGVTDGTIRLSSPPGGPTLVRVEIPCSPPTTTTPTPRLSATAPKPGRPPCG